MADGTCDFVPTNHLGSVEEFSAGAEFFHPGFVSRNVLKGHASLAAGDGLFEVARRHGQVHLLLSDLLDLVGAASVDLPPNGHHGCVPAHVADIWTSVSRQFVADGRHVYPGLNRDAFET